MEFCQSRKVGTLTVLIEDTFFLKINSTSGGTWMEELVAISHDYRINQ